MPGGIPKAGISLQSKYIRYDVSESKYGRVTATLYANPRESGDQIMQMHEKGGSQYITRIVDGRTYRRDKLPGWKENHHIPMEQRSAKQQQAIRDYYANITKKKVKTRASYPARPFMKPAVEKYREKLPKYWQKHIKFYFK